ncbi:MAG TPA: hypothetical protein VMP10_02735 [Chloroflexota bacterium]|nr:hypothetical protein [Chloroflexota bacterium]
MRRPPPRRDERTWLSFLIILLVMILGTSLIWRALSLSEEPGVEDGQVLFTPTVLVFEATPVPTLRPTKVATPTPFRVVAISTSTPLRVVAIPTSTPRPPIARTSTPAPPTPIPVSDAEATDVVWEMFQGLHNNDYDRALAATDGQGREQMLMVITNIQDEGRRRGVQPEITIAQLDLYAVERRGASVLVEARYTAGIYARVAVFRPLVETIVGSAIFRVENVNGQPKIVEVVSAEGLPGL